MKLKLCTGCHIDRWHSIAIVILLAVLQGTVCAQPLQGVIYNHKQEPVYLWQYNTSRYRYEKSDSVRTDGEGVFIARQPVTPGLYGLSFTAAAADPAMYLWLGEGAPVRFSTTKEDPNAHANWQDDRSNGNAMKLSLDAAKLDMRLAICGQLLDMYPDSTGRFYKQVQEEYLTVQREMEHYRQSMANQWKGTAAEHIVRQYYFSLPGKHYREADRTAYQQQHFLDSVNFSDPLLQHSHLLRDKIDQYFRLYGFPEKFQDAVSAANAIRPAIGILMQHCMNSAFTRKDAALQLNAVEYVSGYLFQRFSYMGMDDMIDEVAVQVPDTLLNKNTCNDEAGSAETGISRILTYKKLFVGKAAPEFSFDAGAGSRMLSDVRSKYTLVVFWASWCTHCEEILPGIADLYRSLPQGQLEVIAVSVDANIGDCQSAVASKHYAWLNQCSGKGWNDDIAKSYGVVGTPTMFLLDSQKKIAGKPRDQADLKGMMQ